MAWHYVSTGPTVLPLAMYAKSTKRVYKDLHSLLFVLPRQEATVQVQGLGRWYSQEREEARKSWSDLVIPA